MIISKNCFEKKSEAKLLLNTILLPFIQYYLNRPEMKILLFSALLMSLLWAESTYSQPVNNSSGIQDSLSKLSSLIWKQKTDSGRLNANLSFFNAFQSELNMCSPSSGISLDSINGVTHITSEDRVIQVFTWNVPLSDGNNKYFGFIKLMADTCRIIPLKSNEYQLDDLSSVQLNPANWYGALYYKLIPVEINGRKVYTLLGWDGYTSESNRKLIDIIQVDQNGRVVFGFPVFKTDKGIKSRIVMEYAEKANMLLRYDYQALLMKKGKRIKKVPSWLIVMDRLVPMDPSMKGYYKYYVPSGDSYDGYIFKDGFWILVEDIDVANPVK
jgi:hypothetical protein